MGTYTQDNRPLQVTTKLGKDKLLLVGFSGTEAISQLYNFQLDLLAENATDAAFDKLLGQEATITVKLPDNNKRYISGICSRFTQGSRDATFTDYRMEIVPKFWMLTLKAQSRIFQQITVPDILKKVLTGLDVTWEIQGTFEKRDYCVQYRESDFHFASRLMEEEGIYYFFKHEAGGHKMVVANTPQSHPDLGSMTYEALSGGNRPENRITSWSKAQELGSGRYTLWDHCFELTDQNLEADKTIQESVQAGTVSHKLKVGGNDGFEIYDYPGEYAQRFDGVDPSAGDRASDVQKIFTDNKRTVEIRMQEQAAQTMSIIGSAASQQLVAGHKFTLKEHFNANGSYVLTSVDHSAMMAGNYRSQTGSFGYTTNFTCIPAALPFRPERVTPKPVIQGTQTAIVVGPPNEEIFTDKYGRVKAQFHWDREGTKDAKSSCWMRVGSIWAGKQWGAIHIPRVGQEVMVAFQEGDPDQPIIVGSVYNAENMPPYKLPDNKTQSGIKSRSSLKGGTDNFNELRFEDKKNSEDIYFHAEKDFHRLVENDDDLKVYHDQTIYIKNDRTEKVDEGDESIEINKGDRSLLLNEGDDSILLKMGDQSTKLELGKQQTEAMQSIELVVGQSSIKIDQMGVTIKGLKVSVESELLTEVKSKLMQQVSSDVMLAVKGAIMMLG